MFSFQVTTGLAVLIFSGFVGTIWAAGDCNVSSGVVTGTIQSGYPFKSCYPIYVPSRGPFLDQSDSRSSLARL